MTDPDNINQITVGSTSPKFRATLKKAVFSRLFWCVVIAVVVIAVAVVVWVMAGPHHKAATKKPLTTVQKFQSVNTDTQKLMDSGSYAEANKSIESYLAANPPTTPQAKDYAKQLTVQNGTAYISQKNYPKAIEYYKQSLALSIDPYDKISALHGLAMAYQRSGDIAQAVEQYKAAIAIASPLASTSQQAARFVDADQKTIVRIGGQL